MSTNQDAVIGDEIGNHPPFISVRSARPHELHQLANWMSTSGLGEYPTRAESHLTELQKSTTIAVEGFPMTENNGAGILFLIPDEFLPGVMIAVVLETDVELRRSP